MLLKEYLASNFLVADGAMGTYYAQLTNQNTFPEWANCNDAETIEKIHTEYIQAGAQFIRTNTFSANSIILNIPREQVAVLLKKGYEIAHKAAYGKNVFIAASIGPIPEVKADGTVMSKEQMVEEFKFIVDTFLQVGADLFVFETFSRTDYLLEVSAYIKEKNVNAFVLTQFVMSAEGYSRKGISIERLQDEIKVVKTIDAYGFNCGVGPTHLSKLIQRIDIGQDKLSLFPNAGYPEVVNERMVYNNNPEYFAEVMSHVLSQGVRIIGGCCGTTPEHIRCLAQKVSAKTVGQATPRINERETALAKQVENHFAAKMKAGKFVIAVELDPPFDMNMDKILHNARVCKENGVDVITIADSPLAKARVDSVMIAAKIKREVGIDAMPHICCRDRNINALKSIIMAGHIEEIRNILAVTGDAIPRNSETKSVFNLNSVKLIEFIKDINQEMCSNDPVYIGGALNLNVLNKEVELSRMAAKIEQGARFFLTQPIFEEETIDFLPRAKENSKAKILGGIMPLVSYKNAQFINNEVPGITIPQGYIERFTPAMSREDAENAGIELAVDIAKRIKPMVDGFYFVTPFNRIDMIMKIIKHCS